MSEFHLNLSLMTPGHFRTAWRLPERNPLEWVNVARYRALAKKAEAAKIHAVFLGDSPGLGTAIAAHPEAGLDPIVLFADLLANTTRIGAIATSSTTYNHPYTLARQFLALDHTSGGRAALNIVTTFAPSAAAAFGLAEAPDKAERYRRADEFLQVALGLWQGWREDAILANRDTGAFSAPERIERLDFEGEFFTVYGALSVPPSPQRRPVLVQAGGSPGGLAIAAKYADVVFTAGQDREEAVAFRAATKQRAQEAGRDPGQVLTSLGVVVLIGRTEAEVRERTEALLATTDPAHLARGLATQLGLDPARVHPDTLVRVADLDAAPNPPGSEGFLRSTRALLHRGPLTLRALALRSATGTGHRLLAGTPEAIADDLEAWFDAGAADGFTIMAADTAVDTERFLDQVVPILQARGSFQRDYRGATLRENLGLRPVPVRSAAEVGAR